MVLGEGLAQLEGLQVGVGVDERDLGLELGEDGLERLGLGARVHAYFLIGFGVLGLIHF